MKSIRIGILCPSEIAYRRFMPALLKIPYAKFVGIATANEEEWFGHKSESNDISILSKEIEKAARFTESFGGKIFPSYKELLESSEIDAVYIPLPPALHFKWAKLALLSGKHVFVEKPSTTSYLDSKSLVDLAIEKKLALHENYMFNFHSQLDFIEKTIYENTIGEVRLFRIAFGFPFRGANDFRYCKALGGGALLDCGGYTLKLASRLLGESARIVCHKLNYLEDFDVDIYGSGTIMNDKGQVAQVSFGMDNSYKCELEVWGSKGSIYTNRVLTAPDGYQPVIDIISGEDHKKIVLESDDSFKKSIEHFIECIIDDKKRNSTYNEILKQEIMVDTFKEER